MEEEYFEMHEWLTGRKTPSYLLEMHDHVVTL